MRELIDRIKQMNLAEPYVWRLHLTASEYHKLEDYIQEHSDELSGKPSQELALLTIVYIAEWYRRHYSGSEQTTGCVVDCDAKLLWDASGIDTQKFVYITETGTHLWKYSIYVLGGLATKHELRRNNSDKFLKALCRMYHGEEYTLENLDDESRAIAFRQSIKLKHSLYEFLRSILNDELGIEDEQNSQLITHIKHANEEVLRSKFALEWVVTNNPAAETMNRQLRLWLKPEEVGGGMHQYIKYDRFNAWGITNPESIEELFVGIRWRNGNSIICDIDKSYPLITYSNSGKNGFVAWSIDRYAICQHIPTGAVTDLEIIIFDKDGHEWMAQKEGIRNWMQLWRSDTNQDQWSSRQSRQHQTAVLYSNEWISDIPSDMQKCFKDKAFGLSSLWNWNYIYSGITISCNNTAITLYNRSGYDQVYTKLYNDTISYHEGGKVKYLIEDEEEGEIEELLPLIFDATDIRVRHFATKDAIVDVKVDSDEVCQDIHFKKSNGIYSVWDKENYPQYGIVQLKAYVRGSAYPIKALYLKGPIVRDFEESSIRYFAENGEQKIQKDNVDLNGKPLFPTVTISIGNSKIDVYRPTLIKEIILDGIVHSYIKPGETFVLPDIFRSRVQISDFSEYGYKRFDCKFMPSLFSICASGSKSKALEYISSYEKWAAQKLDECAPNWLYVAFTKQPTTPTEELSLIYWNIYSDEQPSQFQYKVGFKVAKGDIICQDMKKPDAELSYISPLIGCPNPFNRMRDLELKCFNFACDMQAYFSIFAPLRNMADNNKTRDVLVSQLLALNNGELTSKDIENLHRFAKEFGLSIENIIPQKEK